MLQNLQDQTAIELLIKKETTSQETTNNHNEISFSNIERKMAAYLEQKGDLNKQSIPQDITALENALHEEMLIYFSSFESSNIELSEENMKAYKTRFKNSQDKTKVLKKMYARIKKHRNIMLVELIQFFLTCNDKSVEDFIKKNNKLHLQGAEDFKYIAQILWLLGLVTPDSEDVGIVEINISQNLVPYIGLVNTNPLLDTSEPSEIAERFMSEENIEFLKYRRLFLEIFKLNIVKNLSDVVQQNPGLLLKIFNDKNTQKYLKMQVDLIRILASKKMQNYVNSLPSNNNQNTKEKDDNDTNTEEKDDTDTNIENPNIEDNHQIISNNSTTLDNQANSAQSQNNLYEISAPHTESVPTEAPFCRDTNFNEQPTATPTTNEQISPSNILHGLVYEDNVFSD